MIYFYVFLLVLGVPTSQAGCLLKHSHQMKFFFGEFSPLLILGLYSPTIFVETDGIPSLDQAKSVALEKVQLDPTQTICEYFLSENMSQPSYRVQCTKTEPQGDDSHWKSCLYEDTFGDIVMDEEKYAHEIATHVGIDHATIFQLA